jgi:hypothetical protein
MRKYQRQAMFTVKKSESRQKKMQLTWHVSSRKSIKLIMSLPFEIDNSNCTIIKSWSFQYITNRRFIFFCRIVLHGRCSLCRLEERSLGRTGGVISPKVFCQKMWQYRAFLSILALSALWGLASGCPRIRLSWGSGAKKDKKA